MFGWGVKPMAIEVTDKGLRDAANILAHAIYCLALAVIVNKSDGTYSLISALEKIHYGIGKTSV